MTESTVIDTEQRPRAISYIWYLLGDDGGSSCVLRHLVWSQWRQWTHAKPWGGDLLADKPAWLHLPRISIKRPNNHRIGKRLGYQNFYKNFYKKFKTTQQQQNRKKIRIWCGSCRQTVEEFFQGGLKVSKLSYLKVLTIFS